jgi:hypothetical protein
MAGIPNAGDAPVTDFFGLNPESFYHTGAAGSDGDRIGSEASTVISNPAISSPFVSVGGRGQYAPHQTVDNTDSGVPGQTPSREPFTGVSNIETEVTFPGPGSPSSHVVTPSHPNSNGLGWPAKGRS